MNSNQLNDIKTFISNGGTPQQLIDRMMINNSNPILLNLIQMAQKGDKVGVENFARNYLKEQGRDFDAEMRQLQDMIKSFK
jgi:hypothetical protein